jgi:hypothetical protein
MKPEAVGRRRNRKKDDAPWFIRSSVWLVWLLPLVCVMFTSHVLYGEWIESS